MDESRSAAAATRRAFRLSTVVTLHGLWMRAGAMLALQRRLEATGFAVHRFGYPSVKQSLDENAALLAEFIGRVPEIGRAHV